MRKEHRQLARRKEGGASSTVPGYKEERLQLVKDRGASSTDTEGGASPTAVLKGGASSTSGEGASSTSCSQGGRREEHRQLFQDISRSIVNQLRSEEHRQLARRHEEEHRQSAREQSA